jgi:hypothetical protein
MIGLKGVIAQNTLSRSAPSASGLPAQLPESGGDDGVAVDHSDIQAQSLEVHAI